MAKTTGKNNDNGNNTDLDIGLCDLDNFAFADFSNEDFGGFDTDGSGSTLLQSGGLDSSHLIESPHGFTFELNDAESAIIRLAEGKIAGTRGRSAAAPSEKTFINHEDFEEGAERDAFLLIFGYAEQLFEGPNKKIVDFNDIRKHRAIRFFFCTTLKELNFEDAVNCIDSGIRIDVMRLRFMLEFWLRGWVVPPLPDDADGLPARIELMAAQYEGMIGISLAREAWFSPGIDAAELLERVLEGRDEKIHKLIKSAFQEMVLNYVLSLSDRKVYLTGKNPIQELEDKMNDPNTRSRGQVANIYWSRRF